MSSNDIREFGTVLGIRLLKYVDKLYVNQYSKRQTSKQRIPMVEALFDVKVIDTDTPSHLH